MSPLKLFISYAHKDEGYRERLGVHLAALQAEGYYEVWHDRKLLAGQDWAREIDTRLAEADVVLLLVSADLINSRYVWGLELEETLRQEAAGKTRIVSVILKPCRWQRPFSPLASRQALPPKLDRVKSVSEHPDGEEKAFDEVMEGLEKLHDDIVAERGRSPAAPGTGAVPVPGRLRLADTLRLYVGRHPWQVVAAVVAFLLVAFTFIAHGQLKSEADSGWRLLRIGEYTEAGKHFARAKWWPGFDRHGADIARLGAMLPRLGDEAVRREFDVGLAALEKSAPGSGFASYLRGVAKFDDWRLATDDTVAAGLFSEMEALYRKAVNLDPGLAEAHAGLSFACNYQCRLDEALDAIRAAEKSGGSSPPARYAVQKAEILAAYGDAARRREAMNIFETRGNNPRARLLQAMLAWQDGDWARGNGWLSQALKQLETKDDAGSWIFYLPSSLWLIGEAGSKRCLLLYAAAVGERLTEGGAGTKAAWNAVDRDCRGVGQDALEFVCVYLPENAAAHARRELGCPSSQPPARCANKQPAETPPPPARPQA